MQADLEGPLAFLEAAGADRDRTLRRVLSGIGTSAKASARKAYRSSGLSKRSGTLYKSIERKMLRSGKGVVIQAKARAADHVFYGYALAKGSVIRAKDGGWLTFQAGGKWVRKREVRLRPHDFIEGPVRSYLGSAAYRERLGTLVERELERLRKEAKA